MDIRECNSGWTVENQGVGYFSGKLLWQLYSVNIDGEISSLGKKQYGFLKIKLMDRFGVEVEVLKEFKSKTFY